MNNNNNGLSRSEVVTSDDNAHDSVASSKRRNQTSNGLPIDPANGLVFGFLDEDVVEARGSRHGVHHPARQHFLVSDNHLRQQALDLGIVAHKGHV